VSNSREDCHGCDGRHVALLAPLWVFVVSMASRTKDKAWRSQRCSSRSARRRGTGPDRDVPRERRRDDDRPGPVRGQSSRRRSSAAPRGLELLVSPARCDPGLTPRSDRGQACARGRDPSAPLHRLALSLALHHRSAVRVDVSEYELGFADAGQPVSVSARRIGPAKKQREDGGGR
jgi:hypothetical protein